jgi:hypothetical protein
VHPTVVADVHDVERHVSRTASEAEGVSAAPKLRPLMVTDATPLLAKFHAAELAPEAEPLETTSIPVTTPLATGAAPQKTSSASPRTRCTATSQQ